MINFLNWLFPDCYPTDNLRRRSSLQLQTLVENSEASIRKKSLFSCACYRHVWGMVDEDTQDLVNEFEKFTRYSKPELIKTKNIINDAMNNALQIWSFRHYRDSLLGIKGSDLLNPLIVANHTFRLSGNSREERAWQIKLWCHLVRS